MTTEKSDETDRDSGDGQDVIRDSTEGGDGSDRAGADAPETDTGSVMSGTTEAEAPSDRVATSETDYAPSATENQTEAENEEAHAEAEQGSSFAAKALTFLLVLIGGAALGIWGAPKVAPMLPAGLAPVAAWLTPGQSAVEDRIALLQSQVEEEVGGIATQLADVPDAAAIEAGARSVVAEAEARLEARIAALEESIAGSDLTDTRQRLARVEAGVEGQLAELAALKDQLAATGGELGAEAVASLDLYRAEIEGLRAEMATLGGTVEALGTRIDTVAAEAAERVAAAEESAATVEAEAQAAIDMSAAEANLSAIEAAIAAGHPFAGPLEELAAKTGTTPPDGLAAAAPAGVATAAALRERFPDAAYAAIRASIIAGAGDGVVERSRAYLEAQLASRSLTPQPGLSPDAVLSRVEDALKRDDLGAALSEAEALPPEAAEAMADWLSAAQQRADALTGLAELSAALATVN
jgi:hypothetical protein